ncbi:MAG: ATP synthase delta/epsilon chain alpha-helix domain-containing protein, partial [Candidatus Ratteibacteria bacterium]
DRAKKRISEKNPDLDFNRAQFALHRALNRLKVAERI